MAPVAYWPCNGRHNPRAPEHWGRLAVEVDRVPGGPAARAVIDCILDHLRRARTDRSPKRLARSSGAIEIPQNMQQAEVWNGVKEDDIVAELDR